ncbi:Allergen [Penicillium argentinense]|uniref:Allergen n=1 Tax=Penicillium argentinense TaxID=1131581 RepID=A0A9W9FPC0_9EURO|nr:Allergen [Penicillium argentinense]KAJ5103833.1 Allergen [Penicillium argentinense]
MHFKNSVLLAAALTAGSAVARLHGHERRHAHPKLELELEGPAPTEAPKAEVDIEQRDVGDMVYATIDGVLQSWINEWSGEVASETSSTSTSTSFSTTITPTPTPEFTASPSAVESTVIPVPTSNAGSGSSSGASGGNWYDAPSDGQFSRDAFGGTTASTKTGPLDWDYHGNVGIPWGSNIALVDEADASKYKHVIRFEGAHDEPWNLLFWNTYGPDGKMDGFWSPHAALKFSLPKGSVKYVAIDDNTQGGWAAAQGDIPTTFFGQYASTWGEFDMSNEQNDGQSGWDVSCIIAQLNGLDIQGMRICDHNKENCSYIGKGLAGLLNAYTSADQGTKNLAVTGGPGAIRLVVDLDYA